jgi:hypothetical protein
LAAIGSTKAVVRKEAAINAETIIREKVTANVIEAAVKKI